MGGVRTGCPRYLPRVPLLSLVGTSLFFLGGLTKLSIDKIARACMPFIVINIIVLFCLTHNPAPAIWQVKALHG